MEDAVRSAHPSTVKELARLVLDKTTHDEASFVDVVKSMARDGGLVLQEPRYRIDSVLDYLVAPVLSAWLWVTLAGTVLSVSAVLLVPNIFPIVILRWTLGAILVLFLPGYAFLQFLFPRRSELDSLERFALGIGLSLALVPLMGLILYYSPWGIQFMPITGSLSALTVVLAVAAAARKYQASR